MVVVRLMGGLGNQMFQYALGRRLALDHNVGLKLDLSWFGSRRNAAAAKRPYELHGWRIHADVASRNEVAQFNEPARKIMHRILPGIFGPPRTVISEERPDFGRAVLTAKPPVYLIGYWQSEQYFKPIETVIRTDFRLSVPPCPHAHAHLSLALDNATVSVHIRRGDYANSPKTNAVHGTCSVGYYDEAARRFAERLSKPSFLVFSDDLAWAETNLKLPGKTYYVAHTHDCSPHQDIWLMSQCRHHIIANSTFSWWGAWLSCRTDKSVIAPRQWFRDGLPDGREIVPPAWSLI